MGIIGDAFASIDMSADVKENDEETAYAVNRLLNIIDIYVNDCFDSIVEIYVSPLDAIQKRLSDIDKLQVYVVYKYDTTDERFREIREELYSLVSGEFDEVKNGVELDYGTQYKQNQPMLCLYSVFNRITKFELRNGISPDDWSLMSRLANEHNCSFSIPVSYTFLPCKALYIHCGSTQNMIPLKRTLETYGAHWQAYENKKKYKSGDVVYVPMVSKQELRYKIPYVYFTPEDFIEQTTDEELNNNH